MVDRVGQRLGNYRLVRLLGRGGFAEVYLGKHVRLGTQAAVKVLLANLATNDDIESFEKEARNIAHLAHPHIVRVFDFDVIDDTPFLVMDYASGGTLRQRHPKGTILPLPTILSYVKQVADALQYAHEQKFIHRDVKPENILLGPRNEVFLSDFGIATIVHSTTSLSTQAAVGTVSYMAPEQIQEHPRPSSDQYALGIIVYEWLCGNCPFQGSLTEVMLKHLATPPPPLCERISTISPEIEQVVMTALAKDYQQRFASVEAFAHALEQASQSAPSMIPNTANRPNQSVYSTEIVPPAKQQSLLKKVTIPPSTGAPSTTTDAKEVADVVHPFPMREPTSPIEPQPPQRSISRRSIVLGLAGLAIAGSGLIWFVLSQHPSTNPVVAITPTPTATPFPLGTTFHIYPDHTSQVNAVEWSPDGTYVASGVGYGGDNTVHVWKSATGQRLLRYTGHSSNVNGIAWSPDGKRIASASTDTTVQVWNSATGSNILTHRHTDIVRAVAWSLDGTRIASGGHDNIVQIWDASTGQTIFQYRGHSDRVTSLAWSPNGTYIASGSDDKTVQVWNTSTGDNVLTYRGHTDDVEGITWSPDGTRIASGGHDTTVQIWSAATGNNIFTYRNHTKIVNSVVWSPNGKHIASGSDDQTVQVYDASTGANTFTYTGHSGPVLAAGWSPDNTRIASGSIDKTVRVWQSS